MPDTDDSPASLVAQACQALFPPGQTVELRVLSIAGRGSHNASGWFDDHDALAKAALGYEHRSPEGIYITLNPADPICLNRRRNRVKEWAKGATSDKEILRRHWLPIDLDTVRPSGMSCTDTELTAAQEMARAITQYLEGELGFPPGVRAHSGNGFHLLYRVDLPNDESAKQLLTTCLQALHARFSNDAVLVDKTTFNASRIFKLYGTVARKGEHSEERPHRRSRLWKTKGEFPVFANLGIVTSAMLDALTTLAPSAAPAPSKRKKGKKASHQADGGKFKFDLDEWLQRNEVNILRSEPWDGGVRHILTACLFDDSHTNTSACIGRTQTGAIYYRCQHDSCSSRAWKDARELYRHTEPAHVHTAVHPSRRDDDAEDGDDPWQLARTLLDELYVDGDTGEVMLRRHRQSYHQYSRRRHRYRPLSDDAIRVVATRWLGDRVERVTVRRTYDLLNCLAALVTLPCDLEAPFVSRIDTAAASIVAEPEARHWITLTNGILDLDAVLAGDPVDKCLRAHTCDWFTLTALPFAFPVRAHLLEHPAWDAFLHATFEGDATRIELLQEAFGSCLYPDSGLEHFFVFHGAGRNGKSTILNVLTALLGEENVSCLSPAQLADPVMLTQLYGKLANLCGDMPEIEKVEEGVLKAIVSRDLVQARQLYKGPIQFRPAAKLFFASNTLPRFVDTSLGIWRRMILVPFDRVVPFTDVDLHLIKTLRTEMPGILWWALEGMRRLQANHRFTASPRCIQAIREYRLACFPIYSFLEECTQAQGQVQSQALWKAYRQWCYAFGLKRPKPLHTFIRDVVAFMPHVQYTRPSKGMEGRMLIYGLSLVPDLDFSGAPGPEHLDHSNDDRWDV